MAFSGAESEPKPPALHVVSVNEDIYPCQFVTGEQCDPLVNWEKAGG